MSSPKVLTTELRDLLYNQCIDNTGCYSFLAHLSQRSIGETLLKCNVCFPEDLIFPIIDFEINKSEHLACIRRQN